MADNMLHTTLVHGPLAYAMRRAAAARRHEMGLQILLPSQLAARLAGGLLRPASRASIEEGIRAALNQPDRLLDIARIVDLPGMTRALRRTLRNVWRSGYDLRSGTGSETARVRDLAFVEEVVRERLLPGEVLMPDLCRRARDNLAFAPRIIGPLQIEGVHAIDPIWRPLIGELSEVIEIVWRSSPYADTAWFAGKVEPQSTRQPVRTGISCADPAHEALEAMRWARALLADGRARPEDIAICATSPAEWDDYMLALSASSGLPFCFVHGWPALATRDGQRCAALADLLQGGLSQARVRRLVRLALNQSILLDQLPDEDLPVSASASLSTAVDWQRALSARPEFATILVPVLEVLARGIEAAHDAAERLLRGRSRRLWDEALRAAPASALMFTLETLRVTDERDPADAIVWCSADELAGAPRKFVWLLGVTAGSWPRKAGLDPILPRYIVDPQLTDPDPIEVADLRCLGIITAHATEAMLSTGRLTADGKSANAASLLPRPTHRDVRHRDQAGRRALTEADRLFCRPHDMAADAITSSAASTWRAWHDRALTPHDGLVDASHPMLSALLMETQSPTSLSRLLQDPLAYVWHYALGWHDLVHKERGLIFPADDMGRLVHEILRRVVDQLEPVPGLAGAADHEKEQAVAAAARIVQQAWPTHTDVPPPVLWRNTVRQAFAMAVSGLNHKPLKERDTRSYTEVAFGGLAREEPPAIPPPWDPSSPVELPSANIHIRGFIDRLDQRPSIKAVRVTDYKTGQRPKEPDKMIVDHGAELQRVLYALACRTLLSDPEVQIVARLVYLRPPVMEYKLADPDAAINLVGEWVAHARRVLESGVVYAGIRDSESMRRRHARLALPAARLAYLRRKDGAIRAAAGPDLTRYWKSK
jgi:PD-(D/E)XK nuclease superfamily